MIDRSTITHDRRQGLEYAWRQHPATPDAEAPAIAPDADPVDLSKTDPVLALVAGVAKRVASTPEYGVYHITNPGQVFRRTQAVILAATNLCAAPIMVELAQGDGLPGNLILRIALGIGQVLQLGPWAFVTALTVRSISVTDSSSIVPEAAIAFSYEK